MAHDIREAAEAAAAASALVCNLGGYRRYGRYGSCGKGGEPSGDSSGIRPGGGRRNQSAPGRVGKAYESRPFFCDPGKCVGRSVFWQENSHLEAAWTQACSMRLQRRICPPLSG